MSIVLKAWKKGLKPDPKINVVEWSNTYRYLSSEGSAEHGKYDMHRLPFLIPIAEWMSPDDPVQEVYVCKGVQIGVTELGNNILFTYAHLYPRPMAGMLPTQPLLKKHVTDKVWSGVKASPVLRDVFVPIKQGSTLSSSNFAMKFNGGTLNWLWSESPSSYASSSYGLVLASDIDRYPDDVGGEGDPIALLQNRLSTFGANRKFLCESSPVKKKNSKIFIQVMNGDQNRYHMHCPHCNELIHFSALSNFSTIDYNENIDEYETLGNFIYEYDEESYELIGDVTFVCPKSGCIIHEYEKYEMMKIENGAKYIPMNPNFRNKLRKTVFLPSWYSPFVTWREQVTKFLLALKDKKEQGKITKLKVWWTTVEGYIFKENEEIEIDIPVSALLKRREKYKKVPKNVILLSAGVDTQGDRFEVSVYGWVNNQERYLIAHYIVAGDPKDVSTQQRLDKLLFGKFFETEDGGEMKIFTSAIDTGGNKTQEVYDYILKRYKKYRVFAVKGGKSLEDPLVKDFTLTKTSKKRTLKLYVLGVNSAKDDLISDIEEKYGTRYIHFPHDIQHFFDGVTMEHDMSDKAFLQQFLEETQDADGRWNNELKRRNEALDCAIYAKAAIKCVKGLDIMIDKMVKNGKKAFYRKKK